jgi:hypothetical protein
MEYSASGKEEYQGMYVLSFLLLETTKTIKENTKYKKNICDLCNLIF